MDTAILVPVHTYLNRFYRPDCDYVDGEVKGRNMGEQQHAAIQTFFATIFSNHRRSWGIRALTEQRVQTSQTRYRVADVCVLRLSDPPDPIVHKAPLICIEILSRDQTLAELQERLDDYLGMGVENIWIFDPISRRAWLGMPRGFLKLEDDAFSVAGTPIRIPLADLNAELDELAGNP